MFDSETQWQVEPELRPAWKKHKKDANLSRFIALAEAGLAGLCVPAAIVQIDAFIKNFKDINLVVGSMACIAVGAIGMEAVHNLFESNRFSNLADDMRINPDKYLKQMEKREKKQ